MKYLIVLITVFTTSFIVYGQEYTMTCKRITGCPIVNGTCPTCEVIGVKQSDLDIELEKILKAYKAEYNSEHKLKNRKIKPGWGWNGPTWNGLWVSRP
tara:strand:- start:1192 stop:1485 length:294 start_codon:yes stop_codon:yes gene_type:complete